MEDYAGNNLEYWISVTASHKKAIYELRKWSHLKVAFDDNLIWVRGFTQADIESTTVLRIPFIKRFYLSDAHLVPYGKTLPVMVEPNLLWSPIQRSLKISLPKENYNYFGIEQTYQIRLVPSEEIKLINATIVKLNILKNYIHSAFSVRVKHLKWTILDSDRALILGTPILPISGQDLYQNACFLLPAGWKLEYENMIQVYKQALGESAEFWYFIDEDNKINKLRKSDFNQLNKGSFVKSLA